MPRAFIRCFLVLAAMLTPVPAIAATSTAAAVAASAQALCREAARTAAARHGIPAGIMQAITLVETRHAVGGASGPWPWTLNIGGKGFWYDTRGEALAHAQREIAGGQLSVDIGCFQLNYRWHGENFNAPDEMLDPALAADYSARFLGELYAETGDWMRAAGHYHSRTPIHARRYRGMIGRALAMLEGTRDTAQPDAAPAAAPPTAVMPGPRSAKPARARQARAEPVHAIVLAMARTASDPASAAAPGAVMLRMFARPARALLAYPGMKP